MSRSLFHCLESISKETASERGFTLTEVLVATALTSIVMVAVIGHVLIIRQGYFEDIIRTRINSNLRSAMDIISMNVRQAGENLQTSFPAVVLEDGTAPESDVLTLRRAIFSEVLTLCQAASTGDTTLDVSSASVGTPDCTASNIGNVHQVFENYRATGEDQEVRAYVFNRISGVGEFVDYTGGGTSGGEYYLDVSELQNDYAASTSYVYMIEEYRFARDEIEDTLTLVIDGKTDEVQTVAFSVSEMQISIAIEDGSTINTLNFASAATWRDILQISVTLEGEEQRKDRTLSASITAEYFPRNVLSY